MRGKWQLGLFGVVGLLASSLAAAEVFEVAIENHEFTPAAFAVAVGDSIHWTNLDAGPHTVDSGTGCTGDGRFSSGTLSSDDDFGHRITADEAGLTIDYFCDFHCTMPMVAAYTVAPVSPTEAISWARIKALYR
jgi:plastocyanin